MGDRDVLEGGRDGEREVRDAGRERRRKEMT